MWRKMSREEVEFLIKEEDSYGCNNILQMMFDSKWDGKNVALWIFNEGQCYEVREE
jgi:hypothetical protein